MRNEFTGCTKSSAIPSLPMNAEVRAAAEAELMDGETLSGFVLETVKYNIQRRTMQQACVARARLLASRELHYSVCT